MTKTPSVKITSSADRRKIVRCEPERPPRRPQQEQRADRPIHAHQHEIVQRARVILRRKTVDQPVEWRAASAAKYRPGADRTRGGTGCACVRRNDGSTSRAAAFAAWRYSSCVRGEGAGLCGLGGGAVCVAVGAGLRIVRAGAAALRSHRRGRDAAWTGGAGRGGGAACGWWRRLRARTALAAGVLQAEARGRRPRGRGRARSLSSATLEATAARRSSVALAVAAVVGVGSGRGSWSARSSRSRARVARGGVRREPALRAAVSASWSTRAAPTAWASAASCSARSHPRRNGGLALARRLSEEPVRPCAEFSGSRTSRTGVRYAEERMRVDRARESAARTSGDRRWKNGCLPVISRSRSSPRRVRAAALAGRRRVADRRTASSAR